MVTNISSKKIKSKIRKIVPEVGKNPPKVSILPKDSLVINFLDKLQKYLDSVLLIEQDSKILVAVSGGLDSVTLLDSLFIISTKRNYKLAIGHLNHTLRGEEANQDEEFVVNLSKEYCLPFLGQRIDVGEFAKAHSLSIEQAARELRYDFLQRACQSFGANYIATAHTLDDQAETILLNLIRGTGIRGLQGIAEKKSLGKGFVLIRPFFNFKREEILNYAEHRNLKWREDTTNLMLAYTRNKIRHLLIPLLEREFNPNIVEILSRTSELAKKNQKLIKNIISKLIDDYVEVINPDECKLDISKLKYYDSFIVGELVQEVILEKFNLPTINYKNIDSIRKLFSAESGTNIQIMKNLIVFKDRDSLYFVRNYNKENHNVKGSKTGRFIWNDNLIKFCEVPLSEFSRIEDPNVEFFDFEKVPEEIVIRTWNNGDRFVPLGLKNSVKLSDFLVNQKIPLHFKSKVPIVVGNDEIIWVCGFRISSKYKVTKQTKRVLKGEITRLRGI